MLPTSPIAARAQAKRPRKVQGGTVVSWTVLHHPPAGFGHGPRTIGLILLDDGSQVMGQLLSPKPQIGMRVTPRMRLSAVTGDRLRMYDIAYEEAVTVPESAQQPAEFPGYIIALTGPSGVGKSAVAKMLMHTLSGYAARVPLITTAPRDPGERGEYKHVSKKAFDKAVAEGDIAAMAQGEVGGEKVWYGYRVSDIAAVRAQGKFPVVTAEVHLLQELAKRYGRRSILSFGLLPPGRSKRAMLSYLLRQLRLRGRHTEERMERMLQHAALDIRSLTAKHDLFDHILVNDNSEAVVQRLHAYVPRPTAS